MFSSLAPLLSVIAGLCAALAAGSIVLYLVRPKESDLVSERIRQFAPKARNLTELELQAPFKERVIKPLQGRLSRLIQSRTPEANVAEVRRKLVISGRGSSMTVADFLGTKGLVSILLGLTGVAIGFLLHMNLLKCGIAVGIGLVLGFFGPDLWLNHEISKRRKALQSALPDALDLLTIMVEAGLGFDGALQRLVDKFSNALAEEFNAALSEMRLGKSSREALKSLGERCDVEDISTFTTSLIQAQQLGVSLSRVLRIQSQQMRLKRRQRAEEKAHQAPIKMLFPMVFLTFPAMFIVILGPAVPTIMSSGFPR